MENENTQFDGREALIAGSAVRIRSPNGQKKRIRKGYAEKVRDAETGDVPSGAGEDIFSARRGPAPEIMDDGPDGELFQGREKQKRSVRKRQSEIFKSNRGPAESVRRNAFQDTAEGAGNAGDGLSGGSRNKEFIRSRKYVSRGPASQETGAEKAGPAGKKEHFFTDEVKAGRTLEGGPLGDRGGYKDPVVRRNTDDLKMSYVNQKAVKKAGTAASPDNDSLSTGGKFSGRFTESRKNGMTDVSHFSTGRTGAGMGRGRAGNAFYPAGTGGGRQDTVTAVSLQKKQLRRAYAAANEHSVYIPVISQIRERRAYAKAVKESEKGTARAIQALRRHPIVVSVLMLLMLFIMFFSAAVSAGTAFFGEAIALAVTATSYSADDDDIHGAEADYLALEAELREKLADPERYFPGYENYDLQSAEISHDPYRLMALLTVLHERFSRGGVQSDLQKIFDIQYGITTEDITGTSEQKTVRVGQSLGTVVTSGYCNCSICCGRYAGGPTASGVYPTAAHTIAVDYRNPIVPMGTKIVMNGTEYTVEDTGPLERYGVAFDVYYDDHDVAESHGHQNWEAFIADDNGSETVTVTVTNTQPTLQVTLRNYGIDHAARELLNDDLFSRYQLMARMKGNREGLFPDYDALTAYGGLNYAPPGSALSDAQFAAMYYEAVKYLGIEYVWGGETPEGGFDCSGFVSYVINHCGNGWDYGRLTAEEWRQTCMYVPPAEAKPGDLIFFQGTYDTDGASHIGIYLGEGMMVHAGHPVQIASSETPYFQEHFLSYGRIPG